MFRKAKEKKYLRYFPSQNLTETLIFKGFSVVNNW